MSYLHWGYCEKLTLNTIAIQNTSVSIHILSDLQCDHVRNWQRAGWEISESKKAEPRIIRAVKCHSSFSNALEQRVTDINPLPHVDTFWRKVPETQFLDMLESVIFCESQHRKFVNQMRKYVCSMTSPIQELGLRSDNCNCP